MDKKLKIFLGVLVMALCFAAGTLFGPGQAQSGTDCQGGYVELTSPGYYGIRAKQPKLKIVKVQQSADHTVAITVEKR